MPEQALTLANAAEFMGLSHGSMYKLVAGGKIPYRKQGRRLLFLTSGLEQYLHSLPGVSVDEAWAHAEKARKPHDSN